MTAVALDGGTPAVQTASAKTISGALRALTMPAASILHIDATTTQTTPPPGAGKPTIYIGDKNYTEQFILGELYYEALLAQGPLIVKPAELRLARRSSMG